MFALNEQLVLISGASRGLGAAIARAFAREGASVVINYFRSSDAAHALAETLNDECEGEALPVQADVRDRDAVRQMVDAAADHFGRPVATVVHNALVDFRFDPAARKEADDIDWDDYQTQIDGSVRGALHLLQASMSGMEEAGGGRFIAIGSNLVQDPVVPYHDYTTGKAALLGFVRNMASELGEKNITVNMVSGGLLDTTDASAATPAEVFDLIAQNTPRGQVTTPEEVADAVLMMASPWARAVTGQNLIVDGGLVMR